VMIAEKGTLSGYCMCRISCNIALGGVGKNASRNFAAFSSWVYAFSIDGTKVVVGVLFK
jgi:hypothetical protein